MEASQNNNGSDKEPSSYNEVAETYVETNNDRAVPPPSLSDLEHVYPSLVGSEVPSKPHAEQLSLREMHRVPEQPASSSSAESERHSLSNTGSRSNDGKLIMVKVRYFIIDCIVMGVEYLWYMTSCIMTSFMMFYSRKHTIVLQLFYLKLVG